MKCVLVTGAHGFLGRYAARCFKANGYRVIGIGYGQWPASEYGAFGIDEWLEAAVELGSLMTIASRPDVIVHCAGSGSVGFSINYPMQDFQMTVDSTLAVLEYMRMVCPEARLVYPSSAAVYGARPDLPIGEESPLAPVSPYGYHKLIAEKLCQSYSSSFGLTASVIRFFSIYGPELQKQLLWDACLKLEAGAGKAVQFFGTGRETRDWIHVSDGARLMYQAAERGHGFSLLNGGSGSRTVNQDLLALVAGELGSGAAVSFNCKEKEGDPRFYHADISRALALGWQPVVQLEQGVAAYVRWFREGR